MSEPGLPGVTPTRSGISLPVTREHDVVSVVEVGQEVYQRFDLEGRDGALIGLACRLGPLRSDAEIVADKVAYWMSRDPRGPDPDTHWSLL